MRKHCSFVPDYEHNMTSHSKLLLLLWLPCLDDHNSNCEPNKSILSSLICLCWVSYHSTVTKIFTLLTLEFCLFTHLTKYVSYLTDRHSSV